MPENAFNPSALESLLNAGVLGLKVCFSAVSKALLNARILDVVFSFCFMFLLLHKETFFCGHAQ